MDGVALVVGESLVDVVEAADGSVVERPGGSAANAAVALSRLERPVLLATSFGPDERGRLVSDHLAASDVVLATQPHVVARTSVARARIDSSGGAWYDFDVAWHLGPVTIEDVRVLHVCSLAPLLDPGAEVVWDLVDRLAATAVVTYDLNLRPAITGTGPEVLARINRLIGRADLVKASEEDLAVLWPDLDEEHVVEHLRDLGSRNIVITKGAEGARWSWGRRFGDRVTVPALPTEVVDTIGAGDTFGAGLIDALWDHLPARLADLTVEDRTAALHHAAACAAVTVSRVGADPPRRTDLS
ncbi:PfkB family carbohydrate kinase [Nocardioides stalactiti]|uniref:PfkB family carbohydrate kinase n=1 Tax=Nocardioides stalactiti TaxID=2755356 RepID=UPI001600C40B|nr:PfkB family carbohydrate kinase [Nocardioides stalactiti]